jgi:hypothetical protein
VFEDLDLALVFLCLQAEDPLLGRREKLLDFLAGEIDAHSGGPPPTSCDQDEKAGENLLKYARWAPCPQTAGSRAAPAALMVLAVGPLESTAPRKSGRSRTARRCTFANRCHKPGSERELASGRSRTQFAFAKSSTYAACRKQRKTDIILTWRYTIVATPALRLRLLRRLASRQPLPIRRGLGRRPIDDGDDGIASVRSCCVALAGRFRWQLECRHGAEPLRSAAGEEEGVGRGKSGRTQAGAVASSGGMRSGDNPNRLCSLVS